MTNPFDRPAHITIGMSHSVRSRILDELRLLSPEDRGRIWHSSASGRTSLYLTHLMPAIREACHASWAIRELHRFDAVFGTDWIDPETETKLRIPQLFLESENLADTAHHELERLCWSFAPLRLLITVSEWHSSQFPETANRTRLRGQWDNYIKGFDSSLRQWGIRRNGVIAIMVGECGADGLLRFYSYEYRESSGSFFPGPDSEEVAVVGPAPNQFGV